MRNLTFKKAFLMKYPKNGKVLEYFQQATGVEPTWSNINKVRLQLFVDLLKKSMSPNAAKTYAAKFKCIISQYSDDPKILHECGKILSLRRDSSQHVYLSDNEIRKIIRYSPRTKAERIIKMQFLLGCMTGARHSDYVRFTKENIIGNEIHYVSMKTHTKTIVPISKFVKTLIKELGKPENSTQYSDVYFNKILKRICKNVGLKEMTNIYINGKWITCEKWNLITSHTARRSFATNMYKNEVDIYTISMFCGHSTVEMTKTYICCGPRVGKEVLKYLEKYNKERLPDVDDDDDCEKLE